MNNAYEAMFLVRTDLKKEETDNLFAQLQDSINKHNGTIETAGIWQEKKKLSYKIKKADEATYYLMKFSIDPKFISKLKDIYKLNEGILRYLILKLDKAE